MSLIFSFLKKTQGFHCYALVSNRKTVEIGTLLADKKSYTDWLKPDILQKV